MTLVDEHGTGDDLAGSNRSTSNAPKSLLGARVIFVLLAVSAIVAVASALLTVIPAFDPTVKGHLELAWKIASAFAVCAGTVLGWLVKHEADRDLASLHDELNRAAKRDELEMQFASAAELQELKTALEQKASVAQIERQFVANADLEAIKNELTRINLKHEKWLVLVQERHRAKLQALDSISALLAEFGHAIGHIRKGNSDYLDRLLEYYARAREAARKDENLLGAELKKAVHEQTDAGLGNTVVTVTPDTISALRKKRVPVSVIEHVESKLGRNVLVLELVDGLAKESLMPYKDDIFRSCSVSNEHDPGVYLKATNRVKELTQEALATLTNI
jgi:hypothetical protein